MTTLASPISLSGVGLHTGVASRVTLHPAKQGSGVVFRLPRGVTIPATAEYVVDTRRCTVLGLPSGERVSTVEHLLSACVGLGIADLMVEVDASEIPIGDGSALTWVETFLKAGLPNDKMMPPRVTLQETIIVTGTDGAFIVAYPSTSPTVTVAISFPHPLIGTQVARFDPLLSRREYVDEIAEARTFGFIEEVEALLAAGLAKGGTIDNAIVVYPDRFSTPLRFGDEFARHKLLDCLGDFALAGTTTLPNADIIAVKPSHRLNAEFARRLLQQRRERHPDATVTVASSTHKE